MTLTSRLRSFLEETPLHPWIAAAFPIYSLLANNIVEVDFQVIYRPLILSLGLAAVLSFLTYLGLKNHKKASVLTSFLLIGFFSYGHVYEILRGIPIGSGNLGRHRYLIPAFTLIMGGGIWWILKKARDLSRITMSLNQIGLLLLLVPTYQILQYNTQVQRGLEASESFDRSPTATMLQLPDPAPDIFYIVLDGYMRADSLLDDMGFDNSDFIEGLTSLGFYVAECSRSNYPETKASITSALNLDYVPELNAVLRESGVGEGSIWTLLKQSHVRRQLEGLGYQTVAFETGYKWSRLEDADFYLGFAFDPLSLQAIHPFEAMLVQTTAFKTLMDTQIKLIQASFKNVDFLYKDHVERQSFILDQLPDTTSISSPKFVFAHILIPHVPYVFDPNGEIRTNPGFWGSHLAGPLNEKYLKEGYIGQIEFVNRRMLVIVEEILGESKVPPIVILQGDHGLRGENRMEILNAYYFSGGAQDLLYPSITPVNSFRMIFDTFFNTDLGLLTDESYWEQSPDLTIETSPECILNEVSWE